MNDVPLLELRVGAVLGAFILIIASCSADAPTTSRRPQTFPVAGGGAAGSIGSTGSSGFGSGAGRPASGGAAGSRLPGIAHDCADAMVQTSMSEPDILFVVDGSGSMCETFGGSTRWTALRTALLDPTNGLIFRLQQTVDFGLLLYDGTIDLVAALAGAATGSPSPMCSTMYLDMKAMGDCPQLIKVPVAKNNAMAIDMAFPATELGGSTPTDKAMNTAVDEMIAMRTNSPDTKPHPQYIILATDGQPNDICVGGMGGDGSAQKAGVIAAVDRASMSHITTFVISLAGNDPGLQSHLDEVAKHGEPMNPMAHTFNPTSPMDLVDSLRAIVGGAIGCEVILNGMVSTGSECRGKVKVNGAELPCCQPDATGAMKCNGMPTDPANGWVLKDPSTIQLVGAACTSFLDNPQALLTAGFPCDIFVM